MDILLFRFFNFANYLVRWYVEIFLSIFGFFIFLFLKLGKLSSKITGGKLSSKITGWNSSKYFQVFHFFSSKTLTNFTITVTVIWFTNSTEAIAADAFGLLILNCSSQFPTWTIFHMAGLSLVQVVQLIMYSATVHNYWPV